MSRIYCKDCGTYVHEEPQTPETRAAAKNREPIQHIDGVPPPPGYTYPKMPDKPNALVPLDQAVQVAQTFGGLVRTHIGHATRGPGFEYVDQRTLEQLLADAIDITVDEHGDDPPAGDAATSSAHAQPPKAKPAPRPPGPPGLMPKQRGAPPPRPPGGTKGGGNVATCTSLMSRKI